MNSILLAQYLLISSKLLYSVVIALFMSFSDTKVNTLLKKYIKIIPTTTIVFYIF